MDNKITASYSEIKSKKIEWLWYPYIPLGKLTIIQGDPGEGKTSFVLFLSAVLSRGNTLKIKNTINEKINVIYETAEDGKEDTVKPKIVAYDGDGSSIFYIKDDSFSIESDVLENAIEEIGAKLLILDPLQAYLGKGNLNNITDLRPMFDALSSVAERTNCAIVLVGHMNKNSTTKELYRSLGSIDIVAIARSVLLVKKDEYIPNRRNVYQIKNNLTSPGNPVAFEFKQNGSIQWIGETELEASEQKPENLSKTNYAFHLLKDYLIETPAEVNYLEEEFNKRGISIRTLREAKKRLGAKSYKKDGKWYWKLSDEGGDPNVD